MNAQTRRRVIRTDGREEFLDGPLNIIEVADTIKADILDTVKLRHGMVMLLDDLGQDKELPVNRGATFLYYSVCRPGIEWEIRGDVVVVPDDDFAGAENG